MSLHLSLSPVRAYLLVSSIIGAGALGACADQQPTGLDGATGSAFNLSAIESQLGNVTLVARSPGNPRAVESKTAFLLKPDPVAGWTRIEAKIENGTATFSFEGFPQFKVGDRVLAGIEFNPYVNFLEQRNQNSQALFAPFNVANGNQETPLSNSLTYYSAFYTAVGSNNAIPKTVDNLNTILANEQSAAWITLAKSAQTLQPITFPQGASGYAPGRVRSRIVDRNGNTVSFSGNVFGVQELSGLARDRFKCDRTSLATGDQAYKDWFCSLPTALFSVEGTAGDGTFEFAIPGGAYFIDVKGKDKKGQTVNIVRPGHVNAGQTDEGLSLAVPPVRSSYVMQPSQPSTGPNLPYSRGGFESDGAKPDNLTGFIQGYWTIANGPVRLRWTFVENPGQSGARTTVVDLECGTGVAPTACKQVSSGKAYLHGGTFDAATGAGQGVLSIPQGSKTTDACATVAVWSGTAFITVAAPTRHQDSRCPSGGAFMQIGNGNGNTFKLM